MRRLALVLTAAALFAVSLPPTAQADFGFSNIEVSFTDSAGDPARWAGSHPFAMRTSFEVNSKEHSEKAVQVVDGALRNLEVVAPTGLTGNPTAVPRCETLDFLTPKVGKARPDCANSAAVGILTVKVGGGKGFIGEETVPVYNLRPSPGVAGKLGFWVANVPTTLDVKASPAHPYNIVASLSNASQAVEVLSAVTTLWGNPADPLHDPDRGECAYQTVAGSCPANIAVRPFITLPRSCTGPLITRFRAESWWSGEPLDPGPPAFFEESTESPGMIGCSGLGFGPDVAALPTTDQAESPSGLDFNIDVDDEGLVDPEGRADSDIQKTVVTFPEGVTANPSLAEGLVTCSLQDLARETVTSAPGEGCPQASKIGTIEAETPILEGKILMGALFIATQDDPATPQPGAENPFDTLIAQYIVVKDTELGVIVKQAGKLEPDQRTGQLRATFDSLPPVPLSHVRLHLREGGRSPLITPPACGAYTTEALFSPSADPTISFSAPSSFLITKGVGGGPCPPAGAPPFAPGFAAGTLNNHAGSYSPFYMRLTRRDGDQDLTRFDATLPPGVVAKLAGVSRCSDADIALAKAKRGRQELASPSCPANSQIGQVQGGAGVGSQLTYVTGKLYLAGPVGGAPLSVVAIVPAVAGPFDVGTVVVRQALQIDPRTAEVRADGAHSDPLPHILAGIPLRVRDVRVRVDRPEFTLNPTNCDRFATVADIWGGGIDVFSKADDAPVSRSERFHAANCAQLDFAPRLSLTLKGGTKRGDHPALKARYRPRPGDANASGLVTRLPRSAFLDQAHIRTICTRVQFAAGACPKGAIYGHVTAFTPLLEEPLRGPAYLRSSNNKLPDLVFDLQGLVDVEVSARIDSIKGGIRATFAKVPDAPISKVTVDFEGAQKGLIVNSRSLCAGPSKASAVLEAQNGRRRNLRPLVRAAGCKRSQRAAHR